MRRRPAGTILPEPLFLFCPDFCPTCFGTAIAVRASGKFFKLFFTLKTLNENGVKVNNQPGRPAQIQRAFVSSIGDNSGFAQCLQCF
jgi:hypothetical protein